MPIFAINDGSFPTFNRPGKRELEGVRCVTGLFTYNDIKPSSANCVISCLYPCNPNPISRATYELAGIDPPNLVLRDGSCDPIALQIGFLSSQGSRERPRYADHRVKTAKSRSISSEDWPYCRLHCRGTWPSSPLSRSFFLISVSTSSSSISFFLFFTRLRRLLPRFPPDQSIS